MFKIELSHLKEVILDKTDDMRKPINFIVNSSFGPYSKLVNDAFINIGQNGEIFVSPRAREINLFSIKILCLKNAYLLGSQRAIFDDPPTEAQLNKTAEIIAYIINSLDSRKQKISVTFTNDENIIFNNIPIKENAKIIFNTHTVISKIHTILKQKQNSIK